MPALPRGRCPVCAKLIALRNGQLVREHRALQGQRKCAGSGKPARTR